MVKNRMVIKTKLTDLVGQILQLIDESADGITRMDITPKENEETGPWEYSLPGEVTVTFDGTTDVFYQETHVASYEYDSDNNPICTVFKTGDWIGVFKVQHNAILAAQYNWDALTDRHNTYIRSLADRMGLLRASQSE